MIILRRFLPLIGGVLLFVLMAGCEPDNCVDVQCAPAPPPLKITVTDTALVPATTFRTDPLTGSVDTLDTLVVATIPVVGDVEVTLADADDSTLFATLAPRDSAFYKDDTLNLTGRRFFARVRRGNRCVTQGNLTLQRIDGCCPYSIVGSYTLRLTADTCR